MDMDFATSCPLVRPALPHIRFLFVGSRFRSTLPSDGPSRFRPCASLVLHLHQVAQGTFTPRLLDMPSTQDAARRRLAPGPLAASWTTLARGALHQAGRNKGRVNPRDLGSLRGCGQTIVGVEQHLPLQQDAGHPEQSITHAPQGTTIGVTARPKGGIAAAALGIVQRSYSRPVEDRIA